MWGRGVVGFVRLWPLAAALVLVVTFGLLELGGPGVRPAVRSSFTLVGLVGAVAIVVLMTFVPRVLQWLGVTGFAASTGNWLIDWLIVLALIYAAVRWVMHHAPNHGLRVPWTSLGVSLATVGIGAATVGVGIYARFSTSLGAAVLVFGTAVVILLWLYLCFVALLWGAIIEADRQRLAVAASD